MDERKSRKKSLGIQEKAEEERERRRIGKEMLKGDERKKENRESDRKVGMKEKGIL